MGMGNTLLTDLLPNLTPHTSIAREAVTDLLYRLVTPAFNISVPLPSSPVAARHSPPLPTSTLDLTTPYTRRDPLKPLHKSTSYGTRAGGTAQHRARLQEGAHPELLRPWAWPHDLQASTAAVWQG